MKNRILTCFFFFIFFASCKQSERKSHIATDSIRTSIPSLPQDDDAVQDSIGFVKSEFKRINSSQLDSTIYRFQCDERTVVKVYRDQGQIVKATIDWASVGDAYNYEEFYYHNGKLIFEYDLLEGTGAFEGADFKRESRIYIKDDEVFLFTVNGAKQPCKECNFKKTHKAYLLLQANSDQGMRNALCR